MNRAIYAVTGGPSAGDAAHLRSYEERTSASMLSGETGGRTRWVEPPAAGKPIVFLSKADAQAYIDGLAHGVAKHLEIVTFREDDTPGMAP